ncbi:hypothetical protein Tco_0080526 [Tanacetum coccineum]
MDDPNITMEEYIRLEKEKLIGVVRCITGKLLRMPTVSSLNNEINFRISYDESDDEDCTPTVSCFDDLDFFTDLLNEFPSIVYNDAQTSKLDDLDHFKDFENEFLVIVFNDAQTFKSDLLIE